jgi:SAM-dependent methyltransferase
MSIYERILGHPFVFGRIRPIFVGGIDWTPLYEALDAGPDSVVLDIGCGMGIAHKYLRGFREYYGFDTNAAAIESARRNASGPNIHYECRVINEDDMQKIRPTHVLLSGLLHHLSDDDAVKLLRLTGSTSSVVRFATADTVYLPGKHLSNFLAFLDRGRFVRNTEGFVALAQQANLDVVRQQIMRSHPVNGIALYLVMTLAPRSRQASM